MTSGNPVTGLSNIPFERIHLQTGFRVLKSGEKAASIIYVEDGELEAFDDNRILYNIPKGSLIGISSVMDKTPFPYHVRAGKPSTIVKIGQEAMGKALQSAPPWMLSLINSLSKRISDLKSSASKPIFASTLESLAKFLAYRTGKDPTDTAALIREFRWHTRATKEETLAAFEELSRRKFVRFEPSADGTPGALVRTVKPKWMHLLVEFLECERHGETLPAFGLSPLERNCLKVLGQEDLLFTRTHDEWLGFLQQKVPAADIIVMIKFIELGILVRIPDSQKLFLETETLDRFLSAIRGEKNIRGLV